MFNSSSSRRIAAFSSASPRLRSGPTRSNTIRAILDLPADTRLFTGHDYPAPGVEPGYLSTVAEQRASNIHVRDGTSREEFIASREARDRTLALPDRMLHALQVNLRGGRLPPAEDDGRSYFKIPANYFDRPKG